MVGGIEKVYEIGRIFRNEGADATHNPEFTMLEAYEAYGDYTTIGDADQGADPGARRGGARRRRSCAGRTAREHDIGGEWPSVTVHGAVSEALGEEVTPGYQRGDAAQAVRGRRASPLDPKWNRGQVLLEMYEHLVEARTVEPTFYRDFPVEVSPLTREHRSDPRLAEKWDLVAFGAEIGTGYSELVDPVSERARLTAQSLLAAGGDPEAMQLDEDFLRALEYGMPPSGGMGMGIDRLLIMLTGANIRETILFPLVRPE